MFRRILPLMALSLLAAACAAETEETTENIGQQTQNVDQNGYLLFTALNTAEQASVDQLESEIGLDPAVAAAIVAYRSGKDGIEGTADDGDGLDDRANSIVFDTYKELDNVAGVSWATFEHIRDYHVARTLGTLNAASVAELENIGIITSQANDVEAWRNGPDALHGTGDDRLFAALSDVEAVWPHSTANAPLGSLTHHHLVEMPDAACGALWLANHASQAMLDGPIALYSNAAAGIVAYRATSSIDSVSELDAVMDVGPAMIQRLHDYAAANGFDSPAFCAQTCTAGTADPTVYLHEDFSAQSGWTLDSTWETGAAKRSYDHVWGWFGDAGLDHSLTLDEGVAGVVIGGNAPKDLHGMYYLTSPVVDASAAQGSLTLSYYRWLNTDYIPYMNSAVEVFDGTNWVRVWESGNYPGLADRDWMHVSHDLTQYKNASLQVRFGFEITNQFVFDVASWNVDDVILTSGATCQ